MAVYTEITDAALTRFLEGYGLPPAEHAEGIAAGIENTNYRIVTGGRRLILTLYEGRTALGDLPYFLRLAEHLAEAGASAAAPLRTKDGALLGILSGKPAALIVHLDGADIAEPHARHAFAAGRALAQFHRAAAGFSETRENTLGPPAWQAAADTVALDQLEPGLAVAVRERLGGLSRDWPEALPSGTIHADLFPDNVLFVGDDVSGIIDLYFACTDRLAYDLAIAMAAWTPETASGHPPADNAGAMLRGYESVRPLTPGEREALPLLIEGACWRFFLTRAEDWLRPRAAISGRRKDPMPFLNLARLCRSQPDYFMEAA